MSAILQRERAKYAKMVKDQGRSYPATVYTQYTSLAVPIPPLFLSPLPSASEITVKRIDFANSPIPGYKNNYAVVLDNVLSQEECDELIRMVEMSAGAHGNHVASGVSEQECQEYGRGEEPPNNGWRVAMVNAGRNREVLAIDYRNSDRIIWDDKEVTTRLWNRVLQGKGMKEYFGVLDGKEYLAAIGPSATRKGERWVVTEQGLNERMRFLKYGPAQYFKGSFLHFDFNHTRLAILPCGCEMSMRGLHKQTEHCDGTYETPDGSQRSFYTYHLYLNDSAQAFGIQPGSEWDDPSLLRGGATTFWSGDLRKRIDVDPKAGRVLIFQHRGLLHSGDEVVQGVKYTMRSDLMFTWELVDGEDDGGVVFASG